MPLLRLDEFPYVAQDEDLPECVPACVGMVCEYLGLVRTRETLWKQLDFDPYCGTCFDRIADLEGLRISPVATVEEAENALNALDSAPVIANLLIRDDEVLGYELDPDYSLHAVVVLAIDAFEVTFSDPLSHAMRSTESHRECSRRVFEAAWMGGYALRRRDFD